MNQVIFSPTAKEDLIDILSYTQLHRGKNQRAKYRNQLKERFPTLPRIPKKAAKVLISKNSFVSTMKGDILCKL